MRIEQIFSIAPKPEERDDAQAALEALEQMYEYYREIPHVAEKPAEYPDIVEAA